MTDIHYLLLSVALTWLMLMVAAEAHTPTWTRVGAKLAFGNRDALPERSALAARADRAAKNMLENMVLFIGVIVAARTTGVDATAGAAVFFYARLAYFAAYLGGVVYVRSLFWLGSLVGLGWIALETVRAAA